MTSISMNAAFFTASTSPLGDSGVTSTSTLFVPSWNNLNSAPNDVVCFVGKADGLEPDVFSFYGGGGDHCQAANGCGVHVHAGTNCTSTETQLGHWYNNSTLSSDPWSLMGYASTDSTGYGEFANCVRTGYDVSSEPSLLAGRAFIIHSEDGSRVSCGLIEAKDNFELTVAVAETAPIPGSIPPMGDDGVTGSISVMRNLVGENDVSDGVCFQGYALGLEPDVVSFLLDSGSNQCNVTNGCGAHIHNGTACANTQEQGGHYYDSDQLARDPWLVESYHSTDEEGTGAFIGCVLTGSGAMDYENRPFIVHSTNGSRLSCGILSTFNDIDTEVPVSSGNFIYSTLPSALGFVAAVIGLWVVS